MRYYSHKNDFIIFIFNYKMEDYEIINVITRTGKKEPLNPNKITERLIKLIGKEPKISHVNPYELMTKVTGSLADNITTTEIDEYIGNCCASMSIANPFYLKLASRIVVDNHQKNTHRSFHDKMKMAYYRKDSQGRISSLLSEEFYKYVENHQDYLESIIDYSKDFDIEFFGFRTFQKLYGLRVDNKLIERPQDMFLRVAVALHMNTEDNEEDEKALILETYKALSNRELTHASPTCFNAGTTHPQYSSCFLMGTDDSADGIMGTIKDMALISKWGGGIGFHYHNIRGRGTKINGTNGESNGITPFLQIANATLRAFNQGGKRTGSGAVYLSLHHPDIMQFLSLRLNSGSHEERARDLFYAVWVPDIFMERMRSENKTWSLFDPAVYDLASLYDEKDDKKYTEKYLELEREKKYTKQIDCTKLWTLLFEANKETGMPYICFSDTVNKSSMHKHLGTIRSSNLCSEITLYSDHEEYAVCNLASINLQSCVEGDVFNFEKLIKSTFVCVRNLNNIIDKNYYPVEQTKRSNMRHRPIGIGVQGLADAYLKLRYPFESANAMELNKLIFETIYYASVSQSAKLSREKYLNAVRKCKKEGSVCVNGIVYSSHTDIPKDVYAFPSISHGAGSPIKHGIFHFEMCGAKPSNRYDWESLREMIKIYGVRNSFLVALMPTASTSQLLGNNECFEPYSSNIYKRTTLAGEFIVMNKFFVDDMYRLNLWNKSLVDYLIALDGSVQCIDGLPTEIKELYKTSYEISPFNLLQQAIDRQPFVDQSQSINWYIPDLNLSLFNKLTYFAWRGGLKTAKYYLHTKAIPSQKFSIDHSLQAEMNTRLEEDKKKRLKEFLEKKEDESKVCLVCSS